MIRYLSRGLPVLLLTGLPALSAQACPVCFAGREQTLNAFRLSTVALSLLPLLMIGGLAFWVGRRARERDREESGEPLELEGRSIF